MSIDTLYPRLTQAIVRAENLERTGPESEARAAWLDVSMLEEQVAEALPVSDPEGVLARRGAVRAASKAETFLRAMELAQRFAGEPGAPAEVVAELTREVDAASSALELDQLRAVSVVPQARYRFSDAA